MQREPQEYRVKSTTPHHISFFLGRITSIGKTWEKKNLTVTSKNIDVMRREPQKYRVKSTAPHHINFVFFEPHHVNLENVGKK